MLERTKQQLHEEGVSSEILQTFIKQHAEQADRMKGLYDRYRAERLPINEREFEDSTKINNKISNDYRGEIIQGETGYIFGRPISYQIEIEPYGERVGNKLNQQLDRWEALNNLPDLDNETGKISAICGYGARLLYVDRNGLERAVNIMPWETIFIEDEMADEVEYAMRYYQKEVTLGGEAAEVTCVEWYDDEVVTFYIEVDDEFILDPTIENNPQSHVFDHVPLIRFDNNDERMGSFEKVEPLIDAYDRLISDAQNEIEEFRQAYMKFTGSEAPDKKTILAARQSGAFHVPDGDVGFITKDVNDVFLENQKKTLNDNIYKYSSTVDMGEETFSGAQQSGESRKWKLLALENKAINKERKFTRGLREQFKVLASAWEKKGMKFDYLDVDIAFTRNTPIDMLYYADIIQKLRGQISDETLYSQIPFIDDYLLEIERLENASDVYLEIPDEVEVDEPTEETQTED